MVANTNSPDKEPLDLLVLELSLDERKRLYEKMKTQSTLPSSYNFDRGKDREKPENILFKYSKLPWLSRFVFRFLSFFKNMPSTKVFEEAQIRKLGKRIHSMVPSFFSYRRNLLLPDFYKELEKLKEAGRFFYTSLDSSFNKDKGSFLVFLGSLEMPDVHYRLENDANPDAIFKANPKITESEMRSSLQKIMGNAFGVISDEQRDTMYRDTRFLLSLKELAAFSFDRLLLSFAPSGKDKNTCSAKAAEEMLYTLNNVLFSLEELPGLAVLQSLFIFQLQGRKDEKSFDIEFEMQDLLVKAEENIMLIWEFCKKIPLTLILRYVSQNLSLSPQKITGGEDWFMVYREHWKKQIDSLLDVFLRQRKRGELLDSFRLFLKGANPILLRNLYSETNPEGFMLPESLSLIFVNTFIATVFTKEISPLLQTILTDGVFVRNENRAEITEAYNTIVKTEDDISSFDFKISPDGEYGTRYAKADASSAPVPLKMRKLRLAQEEASREARAIVGHASGAMLSMIDVLNGIVRNDESSKFSSLHNLELLGGKKNAQFISGLNEAINQFQQALQFIKEAETTGRWV